MFGGQRDATSVSVINALKHVQISSDAERSRESPWTYNIQIWNECIAVTRTPEFFGNSTHTKRKGREEAQKRWK